MNKNFLSDRKFLLDLDRDRNKKIFIRIIVLDKNEIPIRNIEGEVTANGSINVDGSSALRRTASISFVAKEEDNDLENVENLLSINKRIKLQIGVENFINSNYEDILWFDQGIFIISQPSLSHNVNSVSINLNLKDKMCLLNGEAGGTLPTSVTFDSYDQYDKEGNFTSVKQSFYDIIKTSVVNYGNEAISNLIIEDIPLETKQIVHWASSIDLFLNTTNNQFSTTMPDDYSTNPDLYKIFSYGDEIGYVYTDFVYPKDLKTSMNSNISSNVLDELTKMLSNHEYFYDVDGKFRFREKKNYLNSSYNPTVNTRLDNGGREVKLLSNNLSILDNSNYQMDLVGGSRSSYIFSEGNGLVNSYSNSPNYSNIKNDFHIWGKNGNAVLHYHLVIKNKPKKNEYGSYSIIWDKDKYGEPTGKIRLCNPGEKADVEKYIPEDWRAALYLRGLQKKMNQQRPDVYEQELLDLFDDIYNMKEKKFKADIVNKPNELNYFFDYLEPRGNLQNFSVDNIGTRIQVVQNDNICKLYNMDVPNIGIVEITEDTEKNEALQARYVREGMGVANVSSAIMKNIIEGAVGYSAQDEVRNLINQYTNYNESITIQCVPIYYLEPNTRITVYDKTSNIYGDYMIKSFSIPIGSGLMNINAVRIKSLDEALGIEDEKTEEKEIIIQEKGKARFKNIEDNEILLEVDQKDVSIRNNIFNINNIESKFSNKQIIFE